MSTGPDAGSSSWNARSRLSPRTIAAIVIAVLVLVFIIANRDSTEISFVLFRARMSLWVALTLAAVAGFGAGFLFSRKRYRP
jgi:uncharacterized integral membrane protein